MKTIYFDNAATTFPKPKAVIDKLIEATTEYAANPGRSGHKMSLRMDRELYEARESLTKVYNGEESFNTIFTYNCTDSLNLAIKGSITDHCHVITTVMEHNSVLRPLNELKKQGRIDVTFVKADDKGRIDPADMEAAIREDTTLCVMTAMSNLTGTIMPFREVGEIMEKHGIRFIVDAAQAMGYLSFDMQKDPIDIICFPGHKGLYGPQGTGGLYFKPGVEMHTVREGGTGSQSTNPVQPQMSPDKFEAGTENGPGFVALGEGCRFILETGQENIRKHEEELKNRFIDGLKDTEHVTLYGPLDEDQGPVVALNIEGYDSSLLAADLDAEYGIATRAGVHCAPLAHETIGTLETGAVRFSFGYFNTAEEVDEGIRAVKELAKENGR